MSNLTQDLETLRELNEYRRRAKELREQALPALKKIQRNGKSLRFSGKGGGIDSGRWVFGNDEVEIALLVKVQSHRDLSEDENENNKPRDASDTLNGALEKLNLEQLLQPPTEANNRSRMPVLYAARGMQALVNRAETVFNQATMYCYYRIIRELYGVAQPNWTVGAARAGIGGTTSAFVTNECIRAIFSFKNALERTCKFFEETLIFYEYFSSLNKVLSEWKIESGPLYDWANKSLEARWLDCQIATNPRHREMALFCPGQGGKNALLLPDLPDEKESTCIKSTRSYFKALPKRLEAALDQLFQNVAEVYHQIYQSHADEEPDMIHPIQHKYLNSRKVQARYKFNSKREEKEATTARRRQQDRAREEEIAKFNRAATAHLFALRAIESAVVNAHNLQKVLDEGINRSKRKNGAKRGAKRKEKIDTGKILEEMAKKFYAITRSVQHVLEPSKQYLKWVLNRELAAQPATFDAGELVFAATSYGAIINWRLDERLTRACERLITSLPENGRLPTKRPFHADPRGYRTIPIGCEMTRALANLLQKTGYDFDATFVGRMLGVFEEQLIELHESTAEKKLIGWNFEGAPNPGKPAVWVTAVSVLALDRIVRMLNTRINEIVLAHFDVTTPKRPHTRLTLRDLIYSDYGLVNESFQKEKGLMAIHLQKARAHVMRATLPKRYRRENKNFSTIYYGPPNTGKTTLAESLAFSAGVPLLRLSPGDLILQGQELIEGRAHDVFEALSMLTQCVIIFDEFEPVLKNRRNETKPPHNAVQESPLRQNNLRERPLDELKGISATLQSLSEKDDPKFKFVLGGMLPKLIKLHDNAEKQMFAYCLGTNYLKKIDLAAQRKGRFDKAMPVYKPDALSRAGVLLYRLGQTKTKEAGRSDVELRRFFKAIARTVGEPADRISKLFGNERNENGKDERAGTLKYILHEQREPPDELKKLGENLQNFEEEICAGELDKDEEEKEQCAWIVKYETSVVNEAKKIDSKTGPEIIKLLNRCLRGQGVKLEDKEGLPAK